MDMDYCPRCKFARISGRYSAIPPHDWFWSATGTGEESDYEILYCPHCGTELPDYGELTPAQFFVWYKKYAESSSE